MQRTAAKERNALAGIILLFAASQLWVSLRYNLNWDEYFFLAHIYAALDGTLVDPIQRFHVNLLFWLALLPISEADQLVAGRLFMIACEFGSLFCVFRIARQFVTTQDALFAVAAWCTAGSALVHGASFRADPFAGFLMMVSLTLLFTGSLTRTRAAVSGLVGALGILVTIKAMLFLPAFLGALVWRIRRENSSQAMVLGRFILSAAVLVVAGAVLFLVHSARTSQPAASSLQPRPALDDRYAQIIDKVFLSQSLFPRMFEIVQWSLLSIPFLALVILGLWHAWRYRSDVAGRFPAAIGLAAPLLVLVVYRNAFPYFFPFITLPVAVVAGLGAASIRSGAVRYAVIAALAILIGFRFVAALETDQSAQRETASVVHQMFVEPVPYIDRNGMIPSFPKSGLFMSGWGMDNYRAGLTPSLEQTIARDSPPLLIANSPWLERALVPDQQHLPNRLLERDARLLRDNYIHHWGAIWIAGKELDADTEAFDIVIPGDYLLRCDGERVIESRTIRCGETVHLLRGTFAYYGGPAEMRWGGELPKPAREPSDNPIFYSF